MSFWHDKPIMKIDNNLIEIKDFSFYDSYEFNNVSYKLINDENIILNFLNDNYYIKYSLEYLNWYLKNSIVIISIENNIIIGLIMAKNIKIKNNNNIDNTWYVNNLCILKSYFKTGLSSYLINKLTLEIYKNNGLYALFSNNNIINNLLPYETFISLNYKLTKKNNKNILYNGINNSIKDKKKLEYLNNILIKYNNYYNYNLDYNLYDYLEIPTCIIFYDKYNNLVIFIELNFENIKRFLCIKYIINNSIKFKILIDIVIDYILKKNILITFLIKNININLFNNNKNNKYYSTYYNYSYNKNINGKFIDTILF